MYITTSHSKKIAAAGFAGTAVFGLIRCLCDLFNSEFFSVIGAVCFQLTYISLFVIGVGFALMYLIGKDMFDLILGTAALAALVLRMFYYSTLSTFWLIVWGLTAAAIYAVFAYNTINKGGETIILAVLGACAVYAVVGIPVVRWLFYNLLHWYKFGNLVEDLLFAVCLGVGAFYTYVIYKKDDVDERPAEKAEEITDDSTAE